MKNSKNILNQLKLNKGWKETNDIYAFEPLFDMRCIHCGDEMLLRHSFIESDENFRSDLRAYKCRNCNWFIRFQVFWTLEYLKRIDKSFRKGELFVPVELHEEDKEHAQRLQDLGYF